MSLPSEKEATKIMVDARQSALKRISEILKHPDDLNTKLSKTRQKIYFEKASIDAQMKSLVQSQLDDSQRGLEILDESRKETEIIKSNLEAIDTLCIDSQGMINNFKEIKMLSKARSNFIYTKDIVENFLHLDEKLDVISKLLIQEKEKEKYATGLLLVIHFKISELKLFQDRIMYRAQTLTSDERLTLVNYFSTLNRLIDEFEEYLWSLTENIYDVLINTNVNSIIYILKIVEAEEKFDERLKQQDKTKMIHKSSGYREKFFNILTKAIDKRFAEQLKFSGEDGEEASVEILERTGFIIDDLTLVHDELIPRFPKNYAIFNYFMLEYHRHVKNVMDRIIADVSDTGAILMILRWVQEYYTDMSTRLGVTEDSLEPQLLDGKEDKLINDYLSLNHQKSVEWVTNIMSSGIKRFSEREEPPEINPNGNYNLSLSVILFQIINQQINLAKSSNRSELAFDVVMECKKTIQIFQNGWKDTVNKEYQFYVNSPETSPKGLPEYLIALANDCLWCSEYTDEITKEVKHIFNDEEMEKINTELNEIQKEFMNASKRCIYILIEIMMLDVKSTFSQLYSQSWYDEESQMNIIICTLLDYCGDFQEYFQEYLFTKFITDLNERFVIAYLESFSNRSAKLKMPSCKEKIENDIRQAEEFFTNYRSTKRVTESFKPIRLFYSMMTSSSTMIFLDFYSLWKEYPDVPLNFIENVLHKRDDLQNAQIKEIMEQCNQKAKEEKEKMTNEITTVFSKLSV
ncbi:exocyst complex component Sec6 [Anaeromyces robustus]|uniref:Exocyst complex component Sec6 n=1 Tax=Anaeromyces robustus TaxID=1754192 RepID=A0A1Y1WU51_9FUNG|nr:exocyst complex component Sec6 [Anaeromyces robustus]|eukprot:ORX77043.1 exocyst complex component Sec6 [Anaeromyces robustus]